MFIMIYSVNIREGIMRLAGFAAVFAVILGVLIGCSGSKDGASSTELLNVSYDPTRELWQDVNEAFVKKYEEQTGTNLSRKVSHGGSSSQARSVIDGLDADVVTLAMWSDTNAIAKAGLIKEGWSSRLDNNSLPYLSTIVFVVRKGNPKQIKDW